MDEACAHESKAQVVEDQLMEQAVTEAIQGARQLICSCQKLSVQIQHQAADLLNVTEALGVARSLSEQQNFTGANTDGQESDEKIISNKNVRSKIFVPAELNNITKKQA